MNQLNSLNGQPATGARCRVASQLAPCSPPRPRSLTTSLLRLRKTEPCPPALSILLPPARSLSRFLPLPLGLGARACHGCRGKAMPHPPSLLDTSNHLSTQPHAPPAPPRVIPQPVKRWKASLPWPCPSSLRSSPQGQAAPRLTCTSRSSIHGHALYVQTKEEDDLIMSLPLVR